MSKKWYDLFVVRDGASAVDPQSAPVAEAPEVAVEQVPGAPADAATPEAIYEAASIAAPDHGFTILKVAAMLESEHIRELPADVRRKSVMVALDAAQVPIEDIIRDGIRRDRALDTYERVLEKNLESLASAAMQENRRLEEEIERHAAELRGRIEANSRALLQAREQLSAWRARKQAEEARIAATAGYFVDENPISLGTGAQGGTRDVR